MLTAVDLQTHWALGPIHSMVELSRSGQRVVWKIQAQNHTCILKSASEWESDQELVTQLHLLEHLSSKKLPIAPVLIKTCDGAGFARIDGERWFATEFIAGAEPAPTPENYHKLGNTLARLHQITDFPIATEYTIENIRKKEIPTIAVDLPFAAEYLALASSLNIDDRLPHSVIHTDATLRNTVLNQAGNLILVDWECAGRGTTIIDIGHQLCLRFTSADGNISIPEARAFYSSYFAVRPMAGYTIHDIFEAGLLSALFFIYIGDVAANWKRIINFVRKKDSILSLLEECAVTAI